MPPWGIRRVELLSGLAASGLGCLTLAYVVLWSPIRSVDAGGQLTFLRDRIPPTMQAWLVLIELSLLGVAVGAALHNLRGSRAGRVLLRLATALLWVGVIPTSLSIGLFLLPSAVLAPLTAVAGSKGTGADTP